MKLKQVEIENDELLKYIEDNLESRQFDEIEKKIPFIDLLLSNESDEDIYNVIKKLVFLRANRAEMKLKENALKTAEDVCNNIVDRTNIKPEQK